VYSPFSFFPRWRQPASLVVGKKKKSLIASAIHIPNRNISNHNKEFDSHTMMVSSRRRKYLLLVL
jgi:hypothetical protein